MPLPDIITRSLKLFKTARGVAALRKADNEHDRELAKAALASLFADARGVTLKIGQLFSEMDGGSPFDELAKGIDPYPLATMLPVLEEGLGQPASDVFRHIEDHAIAASLGQVHKAHLLNGDVVAVKIRYPGIVPAVEAEMKLAGLIPNVGPAKKWGIDLAGYKQTLKDNMDRELDYRTEAGHQIAYRDAVNVAGLCVPKIYSDFCSEGVLVQSWEQGRYLDDILGWPEDDRDQVSRLILSTFFHSLFIAGEMHGDPHLGNSLYRSGLDGQPEMALLDYGCMISIRPRQRDALLELILACRDGGDIPAYDCLLDLGFDGEKLSHIQDALPEACKIILRPFISDFPFDARTWDINAGFIALLGDLKWWFRSAGPPGLLLAIRAFHGVISQLESLGVNLPWWSVLSDVLGDLRIAEASARLARRRNVVNTQPGVTTHTPDDTPVALAGKLCIRVTEGSSQIVALAMPGAAAYRIVELMPEDVIGDIRKTGAIDLDALSKRIEDTSAAPQMLFELDRGERQYRVWLE